MKKVFLGLIIALAIFAPHNASAYWRGGCCYGPRFGVGIDFVAPVYAPAYPPVYGGYAYPGPPVYYAPPPAYAPPPQVVYADPTPPAAAPNQVCREYRGAIVVEGKTQQGYGTACRQPDGSWHMVSTQ